MRKTQKILSIFLAAAAAASVLSLAGCKDKKYEAYDRAGEDYDYYLPDYVKVSRYDGIEVPNISYTASNEDAEKAAKSNIASFCTFEMVTDRPCREGDIVDIVTTCYMDGENYPLYTFKKDSRGYGHSITLGCWDLYIDDVDQAIIGKNAGDSFTITFNLPDPFYRSLEDSGKEVTMDIYISSISEVNYSEADDDFYQKYVGYTKDNYTEYMKHILEDKVNGFIEDYKAEYAWNYVCENSELIKLPEKESEELYESYMDYYRSQAEDKSQSLKEYAKSVFGYDDIEDFKKYVRDLTEDMCFKDMIRYYIMRCENIELDQSYYEEKILEYVEDYQIKELEDAESFVDYHYGLDQYKKSLRLQYVNQWIGDHAKVREDVTTYNSSELNK